MQPDHGENPCTPNTLIRTLPERVGEPTGGPTRFFCLFSCAIKSFGARLELTLSPRVSQPNKQERFSPC